MVRLLVGSVIAAILMFAWGFIWWGMLAWQLEMLPPIPEEHEKSVIAELTKALPESGVYFYPMASHTEDASKNEKAAEEFKKKHEAGPLVMVHYHQHGATPMSPTIFLYAGVHYLVVALLLGNILKMASPSLSSYLSRVGFVLALGIVAALFIDASQVIWFYQSWKYWSFQAGYHAGGMFVAGLVLAAFIRPIKAEPTL